MTRKSKNIANILILLGILITLFAMGYKILSNGIYSPQIVIGKIQIDGFYLRLNNKLILEIETLDISNLQESPDMNEEEFEETLWSADNIGGMIKKFLFVISYFEKLNIQKIIFADKKDRSVHYDGKEYKIIGPELVAIFAIENHRKVTELNIYQLDLMRFGLQIDGKFIYHSIKNTIEMDIEISPKEQTKDPEQPTLYVKGLTNFQKISMDISSSNLYNLETIKPYIKRLNNATLNNWLFRNVRYDSLKINSLKFYSTLDYRFLKNLQKSLELDAVIVSPKVYLSPNLEPIKATNALVYVKNEDIVFALKEPTFTDIKLDGSEVRLSNVFAQPLSVKINILSNNVKINDALANLLGNFQIPLPIRSVDSNLRVNLGLDITPQKANTQVLVNGHIISPQSTLQISQGQKIDVSGLNIAFKADSKKRSISVNQTKVNYANSIKGTLNVDWDLNTLALKANLGIDTFALSTKNFTTSSATLPKIPKDADETTQRIIKAIHQDSQGGAGIEILKIDKKQIASIDIVGDLAHQTKILSIPIFGVQMSIADKNNTITLQDLDKVYTYSPLLQYVGIKKGSISLNTQNFDTIDIAIDVDDLAYPIYHKDSQRLKHISMEGKIGANGILMASKDKKLIFIKTNNTIKIILNDYNLKIDEIFSSSIPVLAQLNEKSEEKQKITPEQYQAEQDFIQLKRRYEREHNIQPYLTYVEARNMNFYLDNFMIPTDIVAISLRDGIIRADATYGNGVANVDIFHSIAQIKLNNFSDKFLNQVWDKEIFSGGLFNFRGVYEEGALRGKISMQNTIFKDFAIVQNILALIDTIPALVTFRKPGLGSSGYEIKHGEVFFSVKDQYFALETINLIGTSIDVKGEGFINLEDKTLDIALEAFTIKTLADIISKIPIVGYVILGEDGKFSTNIAIKGTLDDPKSEVGIAEDILTAPFKMIERIFKPLDDLAQMFIGDEQSSESLPQPSFSEENLPIQDFDTPEHLEQDFQNQNEVTPTPQETEDTDSDASSDHSDKEKNNQIH